MKKSGSKSKQATKTTRQKKKKSSIPVIPEACFQCEKAIADDDKVLFVEEEVGRMFCSEKCILAFFTPEIEQLENEYFRVLSPNDLGAEEREKLAHLRLLTFQDPGEVWRQKMVSGDFRYTLVSEYSYQNKPIWCVCICLFLRGEPSFLYLGFITRNEEMVRHYRRGEQVDKTKLKDGHEPIEPADESSEIEQLAKTADAQGSTVDGLARPFSEEELLIADMAKKRRKDDIPEKDYEQYQACVEETLQVPDEVWAWKGEASASSKVFHFIKAYPDEKPRIWYVIMARETEEEDQLEIIEAFPTRDESVVERLRYGQQEIGKAQSSASGTKFLH